MRQFFVYILRCNDGSLYTGWSTDPWRRLNEHNSGTGARYTRTRRPVEMVYLESVKSKRAALRRELQIKSMARASKLKLVGLRSGQSFR